LDLAGLAVVFFLLSQCVSNRADLFLNLFSEMAGAFVTYVLLVMILERTEDDESEKDRLITEMGSSVNNVAVGAAEKLKQHGGLTDGWLQGARLNKANLQGADLGNANLQGAALMATDLQRANLGNANLQGAILMYANLQGANLAYANLRGATVALADLKGAYLGFADLQEAALTGAKFNESTTLPDDADWRPDTDLARFTDPLHPEFWRSGNIPLPPPAYRGDDNND
jgi:hypothetical protein